MLSVVSISPNNKANDVAVSSSIVITFNKDINPSSVTESSFVIAAKKTSIVNPVGKEMPSGSSLMGTSSFFESEFTAIVEYKATVSGAVVTLFPTQHLSTLTTYTITIGQSIVASDADTLSTVKRSSFTTRDEDISEEVAKNVSSFEISPSIFDSVIAPTQEVNAFKVVSSTPKDGSFLSKKRVVTLTLNEAPLSISGIQVYSELILSDNEPELIEDATIELVGSIITVTIPEDKYSYNTLYSIVFPVNFESVSGKKIEEYTFQYVGNLNPYHSSTKLLRLKAGGLLSEITDAQLSLLIHLASSEIDSMSRDRVPDVIKAKYTLMTALRESLISNASHSISSSINKKLGEFQIQIDNKSKVDLLNKLLKEIEDWKSSFDGYLVLLSGGNIIKRNPANYGRTWSKGMQYSKPNSHIYTGDIFLQLSDSDLNGYYIDESIS